MVVKNIADLAGDGIGPEVVAEARKVLVEIQEFSGHELAFTGAKVGGAAWEGGTPTHLQQRLWTSARRATGFSSDLSEVL